MKHLLFAVIWLCTFTIYAKLPALIPREVLFGNLARAHPEISPDGAQIDRPENNLGFYGRVEEFLAKHLGGRAEPWKKISGSTAELR
jgi:hypothetical protein